jgi:hypothetical protein
MLSATVSTQHLMLQGKGAKDSTRDLDFGHTVEVQVEESDPV